MNMPVSMFLLELAVAQHAGECLDRVAFLFNALMHPRRRASGFAGQAGWQVRRAPLDLPVILPDHDVGPARPGPEPVAEFRPLVGWVRRLLRLLADGDELIALGIGGLDDEPVVLERHRDTGPFSDAFGDRADGIALGGEAVQLLQQPEVSPQRCGRRRPRWPRRRRCFACRACGRAWASGLLRLPRQPAPLLPVHLVQGVAPAFGQIPSQNRR